MFKIGLPMGRGWWSEGQYVLVRGHDRSVSRVYIYIYIHIYLYIYIYIHIYIYNKINCS